MLLNENHELFDDQLSIAVSPHTFFESLEVTCVDHPDEVAHTAFV